jgi:hypothetical protein
MALTTQELHFLPTPCLPGGAQNHQPRTVISKSSNVSSDRSGTLILPLASATVTPSTSHSCPSQLMESSSSYLQPRVCRPAVAG